MQRNRFTPGILLTKVVFHCGQLDALAAADSSNRWLTVLHYSFFDETHLYMVRRCDSLFVERAPLFFLRPFWVLC